MKPPSDWGILKSAFGPESVAFFQGSAKGMIDVYNERFASVFGTPNFTSTGHVCFLPRLFASKMTCGSMTIPDYDHPPGCILIWGANLSETRINEHFKTVKAFRNKATLIVTDPVKTVLAGKADTWLRLRPGTDLALALSMISVIIEENLYDHAFVEKYTLGFKRLAEHVREYAPEKTAHITWVDAETVRTAATVYATHKPACIQWGNAVDHGVNSFQTVRALSILKAITGNLDVPGGDLLPDYPLSGPNSVDLSLWKELPQKSWNHRVDTDLNMFPHFHRVLPGNIITAILEGKPYPIRCAYIHAANPLLSHANARKTYQALNTLDFFAVSEFFMTPTAEMADIVFPAATYLEYDSIVAPPYYPYAQVQQKAVTIDDCRSDFEIKNGLARRLKMADKFHEDMSVFFNEALKPAGIRFDDFKKIGCLVGIKRYGKYKTEGFATPSGKVELYSEKLEEYGFQPMPAYIEPLESPLSGKALANKYPMVLTTKKSVFYLHSSGRQIKSLRAGHPDPVVWIHPITADKLGIEDGDFVYIETVRGRITQKAHVTDKVDERVVCADFAWWYPETDVSTLYDWDRANINILIDDLNQMSPETGSPNLRGILCRVTKAQK